MDHISMAILLVHVHKLAYNTDTLQSKMAIGAAVTMITGMRQSMDVDI